MEDLIELEQLLALALDQAADRDPGPTTDDLSNLVLGDFLSQQRALAATLLLTQLGFFELEQALGLGQLTVLDLSRPIEVERYGAIYAGAQKNIGPAGLTMAIVRKDLLGKASAYCPAMMDYKIAADNDSMYNTPPTYGLYLAGLVFDWLKQQGGLTAMEATNRRKAEKLYGYIDNSGFYANPVEVASRSLMNVPFTLASADLDKAFLAESEEAGMLNLKGHRSVGGMRASIYNAVPEAAVDALIDFMKDFAQRNG